MPTPDTSGAHGLEETELSTALLPFEPALLFTVEFPEKSAWRD
jgi:hypothetical protein